MGGLIFFFKSFFLTLCGRLLGEKICDCSRTHCPPSLHWMILFIKRIKTKLNLRVSRTLCIYCVDQLPSQGPWEAPTLPICCNTSANTTQGTSCALGEMMEELIPLNSQSDTFSPRVNLLSSSKQSKVLFSYIIQNFTQQLESLQHQLPFNSKNCC